MVPDMAPLSGHSNHYNIPGQHPFINRAFEHNEKDADCNQQDNQIDQFNKHNPPSFKTLVVSFGFRRLPHVEL